MNEIQVVAADIWELLMKTFDLSFWGCWDEGWMLDPPFHIECQEASFLKAAAQRNRDDLER